MATIAAENPVFQAILTPHRSLSRRGVCVVVGILLALSCLFGVRFWLWGAWPVVLFSLLEIPLVVFLLALNFRRARQTEMLLLTGQDLTVIQTDHNGRRRQVCMSTAWLRISLRENGGAARIVAQNRHEAYEIGAFLHDPDRRALYEALRDALHEVKNPRFDNPQLRDV